MTRRRSLLAPAFLLFLPLGTLLWADVASAQATTSEQRLAERLLELEEAIEELLAQLSPEGRARVRALAAALKEAENDAAGKSEAPTAAEPAARLDERAGVREAIPPRQPPAVEPTAATPRVVAKEPATPTAASPEDEAPNVERDATETPIAAQPTESATGAAPPIDAEARQAAEGKAAVADRTSDAPTDACQPLAPFDTSGDGLLSGADRLWRHFYLETDLPKDDGIVSLFDLDIRSVALEVDSYGVKGDAEGYVQRTSRYRFQLIGRAARKVRDGFLAVDAGGLARNGTLVLLDASGNELDGIQVLQAGQILALASGEQVPVLCR